MVTTHQQIELRRQVDPFGLRASSVYRCQELNYTRLVRHRKHSHFNTGRLLNQQFSHQKPLVVVFVLRVPAFENFAWNTASPVFSLRVFSLRVCTRTRDGSMTPSLQIPDNTLKESSDLTALVYCIFRGKYTSRCVPRPWKPFIGTLKSELGKILPVPPLIIKRPIVASYCPPKNARYHSLLLLKLGFTIVPITGSNLYLQKGPFIKYESFF